MLIYPTYENLILEEIENDNIEHNQNTNSYIINASTETLIRDADGNINRLLNLDETITLTRWKRFKRSAFELVLKIVSDSAFKFLFILFEAALSFTIGFLIISISINYNLSKFLFCVSLIILKLLSCYFIIYFGEYLRSDRTKIVGFSVCNLFVIMIFYVCENLYVKHFYFKK